jgi:hypothetical protein
MVKFVKDRRGSLNGSKKVDMTTAKKIKTTAAVFELPQRLGILQYVEYEPPPREWCTRLSQRRVRKVPRVGVFEG